MGSGLFPICQRGAKKLFGVGFGLIHSILETPKAPSHPHAFRVGVPGISTAKNQNPQTSPLICKGEIVQRYKAKKIHREYVSKYACGILCTNKTYSQQVNKLLLS